MKNMFTRKNTKMVTYIIGKAYHKKKTEVKKFLKQQKLQPPPPPIYLMVRPLHYAVLQVHQYSFVSLFCHTLFTMCQKVWSYSEVWNILHYKSFEKTHNSSPLAVTDSHGMYIYQLTTKLNNFCNMTANALSLFLYVNLFLASYCPIYNVYETHKAIFLIYHDNAVWSLTLFLVVYNAYNCFIILYLFQYTIGKPYFSNVKNFIQLTKFKMWSKYLFLLRRYVPPFLHLCQM